MGFMSGLLSGYGGGMAGGVGSPGQPVGDGGGQPGLENYGGGKLDKKKVGVAAVAAPLLALLASKMSGGALGFPEALGHLGKGFADTKLDQMKQNRQREFDQQTMMMDEAHKAVQEIGKLDPNIMSKFPALGNLAQKYQQALLQDSDSGSAISPKEAQQIIAEYSMAKSMMTQAQNEQKMATEKQQYTSQARTQHDVKDQLEQQDISGALGAEQKAPGFVGPPADQGQLDAQAQAMLGRRDLGVLERTTPQPYDLNGHTAYMLPNEASLADNRSSAAQRALARLGLDQQKFQFLMSHSGASLAQGLLRVGTARNATEATLIAKLLPGAAGDTQEEQLANAVQQAESTLARMGGGVPGGPRTPRDTRPAKSGKPKFQLLNVQ